jgi:hypothetical protein
MRRTSLCVLVGFCLTACGGGGDTTHASHGSPHAAHGGAGTLGGGGRGTCAVERKLWSDPATGADAFRPRARWSWCRHRLDVVLDVDRRRSRRAWSIEGGLS